jgi:hypothetical protein
MKELARHLDLKSTERKASHVEQTVRTVLLLAILLVAANQFILLEIPAIHGNSQKLQISVVTNKKVYSIDEFVNITVIASNYSSENVTLQFASSCHASFSVEDSYGVSWYVDGYVCAAEGGSITFTPGQSVDFHFLWDQLDKIIACTYSPRLAISLRVTF